MGKFKNMEEAYEYYLQHPEKEIVYDGIRYFRLIHKTAIRVHGELTMVIVVPLKLLDRKKFPLVVEDETGEKITLMRPVHYSFHGEEPDWYANTRTFAVRNVPDVDWYIGIPNEEELSPEQEKEEAKLHELATAILLEMAKGRTIEKPDGVEEWDGGINVDHRWQFSSEAERIAVLRCHLANIKNRGCVGEVKST